LKQSCLRAKVNCIVLYLSNLLDNNIERLRERKLDLNAYDGKMTNIQGRFKGVASIISLPRFVKKKYANMICLLKYAD